VKDDADKVRSEESAGPGSHQANSMISTGILEIILATSLGREMENKWHVGEHTRPIRTARKAMAQAGHDGRSKPFWYHGLEVVDRAV
jgi:hypothetical protein